LNTYSTQFIFIQYVSCLISIIVGIKLLKNFDISLKLIFSLLCFSLMTDIISFILVYILKVQSIFIVNVYSVLEFVLLSFFYISIIEHKFFKRLVLLLLLIYILAALFDFYANSIFSSSHYKINSFANFLVSFYAIYFFIHSLYHNSDKILTRSPLFWINSGVLIYYMPFILILLFSEYLSKNPFFFAKLFNTCNNLLVLIFMSLVTIGFLKSKNKNYEIKTK
jgi:hypothetical protein